MKTAIIGCGTIANSAHIPAYMKNKEAEIAYFCDILPERAEKAVQAGIQEDKDYYFAFHLDLCTANFSDGRVVLRIAKNRTSKSDSNTSSISDINYRD